MGLLEIFPIRFNLEWIAKSKRKYTILIVE